MEMIIRLLACAFGLWLTDIAAAENMAKEPLPANCAAVLRQQAPAAFLKSIDANGVWVVRYFNSGGYGTRGRDFRRTYSSKEIRGVTFPVQGESAISVADAIAGIDSADLAQVTMQRMAIPPCASGGMLACLSATQPGDLPKLLHTMTCTKNCTQDIRGVKFSDELFAVTDLSDTAGVIVGGFALLKKTNKTCQLVALVDIR